MIPEPYQCRTWAEISLHAARQNYRAVRNAVREDVKVCCVIKANAYGHGAVRLAGIYEEEGADYFAVSNIEEAVQLRAARIVKPILILGYTDPRCAALLAVNNISQCVYSRDYAAALSENAVREHVTVNIHIKIDTGMGRIGFVCRDGNDAGLNDAFEACSLPGLLPEGIFTHFASADEGENGRAYTMKQYECFRGAIGFLESKGITFSVRHCANSAAIFDYPETHMDMVRAGIVLYGYAPSDATLRTAPLAPLMTLKTVIDHVKTVKKGESVSYGRTFTADKDMRVGTIPIGYADGLWRSGSANGLCVKVEGQFAAVLGRICMDQCMIDITDIPAAKGRSVVTVYGKEDEISPVRIAARAGSIPYEVLCAVGERVPRIYTE